METAQNENPRLLYQYMIFAKSIIDIKLHFLQPVSNVRRFRLRVAQFNVIPILSPVKGQLGTWFSLKLLLLFFLYMPVVQAFHQYIIPLNILRPRQICRNFKDEIFKCIWLNEKYTNFAQNVTEVCSSGTNLPYSSIGSDNVLVPTRRQAIIWTNDGWLTDAYMRHSASISTAPKHISTMGYYTVVCGSLRSFWDI